VTSREGKYRREGKEEKEIKEWFLALCSHTLAIGVQCSRK
jgi:hypothetical protein